MSRYAIGVDFGTESGRAVLVDVADGRQVATAVYPYANGVIDERLPLADRERPAAAGLGAPGSRGLPARSSRTRSRPCSAQSGVDPARRHRHRHRLHRLHDAAGHAPTARRCACCPSSRAKPHAWVKLWKHHAAQPEADRINEVARATGQPWLDRYGGKISLRVVLLQGAADPRRGAGGLRRGRPADRGRRLGRLAADRRRDAQRLHRRLQGDVVEARRLPATRLLRRPRPATSPTSSTTKMSRDIRPMGERAGGLIRARRRPGPACGPGRPSPSPTSTRTSRSRPRPSPRPAGWS